MSARPRPTPGSLPAMLIGVLAVVGGLALLALRSDAGRDRGSRVGHVPQRPRRLERLRAAIVGNTKRAVASILGPPRVATFPGTSPASSNYLEADAWYYPLRTRYPAGMVIRFDDTQLARAVEFFDAVRG